MNILSLLADSKKTISLELDAIQNELLSGYPTLGDFSSTVLPIIIDFTKRGKMIRGGLLVTFVTTTDSQIQKATVRLAAILELLQSGILMHDDIIDNDETRRGVPSTWAHYAKKDGKVNPQYGKNQALCVGDIAYFTAIELLPTLLFPPTILGQVIAVLGHEMATVGLAEMQDVAFAEQKELPTKKEIESLYQYKTARYTFSLPLLLASIISAADEETKTSFVTLGERIGILFQMRDDYLGLFGDPKITGKPVGNDIREGKKTIYIATLLEKLEKEKKEQVLSLLQQVPIAQKESDELLKLLSDENIVTSIQNRIDSDTLSIRTAIQFLNATEQQKEVLFGILEFVTTRNK